MGNEWLGFVDIVSKNKTDDNLCFGKLLFQKKFVFRAFVLQFYRMKTKIFVFLFSLFCGTGTVFAQNSFINVSDSVAGQDVSLRISGLLAEENVGVKLERPGGSQLFFEYQADMEGIVNTTLSGLHVRKAGMYEVSVIRNTEIKETSFQVSPSSVSAYRSDIVLDSPSVMADGEQQARFRVVLRDAFDNPIAGKNVRIVSSRNEDQLTAQLRTDSKGVAQGKVVSATPGISTLSAVVGDIVVFEKPEIVFYLADISNSGIGSSDNPSFGDYLKTQLFGEDMESDAAYFSLENIKREVTVDENLTVKIVAKDENGNIVENYQGTIRFSSSDDQAELPTDYRFTPEDQGSHTFFLAIRFRTPGTHTLAVHDLDDFRISGELDIEVSMGQGEVLVPPEDEFITLLTPRPGTYRSSRVTITGESGGCEAVKIMDGSNVLVDGQEVDGAGNFVYQTPVLASGVHKFIALCSGNESLVSNELSISIDREAPQNINVIVEPAGDLEQGQPFEVIVTAEEPLSGAQSIFLDVLTEHESEGEAFVASLIAPSECGEYPVDVTAIDLLGNESQFPKAALIRVCGEDSEVNNTGENGEDTVRPLPVSNLQAQSGEGKVTLFWSPAEDNSGIQNYRVEFATVPLSQGSLSSGQGAGNENLSFDQFNTVPDNRTQWYIDNLDDDKKYFFRVVAIDSSGNESMASDVIEGLTQGAQEAMHQSAPKQLEKSGSGSVWAVIFALIAGGSVLVLARRRV